MNEEALKKAQYFYNQAWRFMKCAERCMGTENDDGSIQIIGGRYPTLSTPTMVNAAFSCEVFLKAILILFSIDYKKGHGLRYLYELLPNEEYKEYLKIAPSSGQTFEEELDAHSEDFVAWRYYMETPGEYQMSPMFTFLLMNNLQSLSKALIEQHLTQIIM